MLQRLNEQEMEERNLKSKSCENQKPKKAVAAADSAAEKMVDDYINAYEQKKKE